MTSDEDLMLACGRGERGAFDTLFERYRQPIWGYFRRRLEDRARAEELAQDTFVAVLNNAARYEVRASFRTYLYSIAANLLSAERRRPGLRDTALPARELPAGPASAADAGHIIRDAVSRLDPHAREILMLREFEQLTYSEIAQLLDLPINTVRSRLFRARGELRQLLESQP
jgi:RNA polymerase sigma-70 factor (ECF subfamily)